MQLDIIQIEELTPQNKQELDLYIEQTINAHKENSAQINKLVIDSVTALTASQARSAELASQGFLKRFWGGLSGKNSKIRNRIDLDLSQAQYASQQMIQKLAEQNLMTFETVTLVNNKLNVMMIEVEEEINTIYGTLIRFFKQTRSDLIQMENRLDTLERNVNLLQWSRTIEYQMYNGLEYSDLTDIEKICCIVNDFYHIGKGDWNTSDLLLLKSTLSDIELPVREKISYQSFFRSLVENQNLIGRLFEEINLDSFNNFYEYEIPLLKGIEKATKLQQKEKYVVDTLKEQLDGANVTFNEIDLQISMIHNYLKNSAYMLTDKEVNIFELVVELLANIKMIDTSSRLREQEELSVTNPKTEVIIDEKKEPQIGEFLKFGKFNNKEINWQIINVLEDYYLLFSTDIVDDTLADIDSWDDGVIRFVLNSEDHFLEQFHFEERNIIVPTKIESIIEESLYYDGPDKFITDYENSYKITTTDRVFLLSLKELKELVIDQNIQYNSATSYFLRDATNDYTLRIVDKNGEISKAMDQQEYGIRPAMYIKKIDFPYGNGSKKSPYYLKNKTMQSDETTLEIKPSIAPILDRVFIRNRKNQGS
ncbi:DUF6273 domain-containing protein [Bacillus cereus group sp. LD113LC]|uniref:DUF6273 domain-containing protein n=1 Tax=unclassified Bacillus cereus group TaxID=2750818 RepID=UPI0022E26126|nr:MULTISPECIES: DUF6273 domain-containing protein [unclassified Bacillus cereus group]MDA1542422.1 DUF6273 domain-containing protein [Bacillus cereus group sp. TH244-1LC]MDA1621263.1 DUF6273 domain-containing protein [Bacillus cereus group sp. TH206-1LC]MDA1751917.1 DUF6273 domain-containing protein [Bacillus cereus group sp. LD113LC]